jgi:hypothetical protein
MCSLKEVRASLVAVIPDRSKHCCNFSKALTKQTDTTRVIGLIQASREKLQTLPSPPSDQRELEKITVCFAIHCFACLFPLIPTLIYY